MTLQQWLDDLSRPAAYAFPVDAVEVHQTHISVVFLAGPFAYKIKKPVRFSFVDFSSLEKRRHFCEEEVRLNRRLAPTVYLGVVAVTPGPQGACLEGSGEPLEWAVKMRRLPAEASLERRLEAGTVQVETIEELARRVASFHAHAESNPRIQEGGSFATVARNARENFEQSLPQFGVTLSLAVFERLRELTETWLDRLQPLLADRARRGLPRDTHGDLHLDHVYLFPERPPPEDLVIIDCIEFNDRFRHADPIADMAFLVMDLLFHRRRDLAAAFVEAYFRASGDEEGRALLPFYTAYRAAVRGKVEGMKLSEPEIPTDERAQALTSAGGHWLLALGELEEPSKRPALVLVGGLPGSGKSTLARALAERASFVVLRSDQVRKELAGLDPCQPTPPELREQIYKADFSRRTYTECLRRADTLLFEGRRVLIDASFQEDRKRLDALAVAARRAVPGVLLVCEADVHTVRARLAQRHRDVSDADWQVYLQMSACWEKPSDPPSFHPLAASISPDQVLAQALGVLEKEGLW